MISYYPFGGAIALALDLTLRDRTDGRVSLDDFMRAMWQTYGKPGGSREGYVDHPYTIADAEATLAAVSGDKAFARDFFARYIQGHDVADYARLLAARRLHDAQAQSGTRVARRPASRIARGLARRRARPADLADLRGRPRRRRRAAAGRRSADGSSGDIAAAAAAAQARATRMPIVFVDRTGAAKTASVTLGEDPHTEVVPVGAGAG